MCVWLEKTNSHSYDCLSLLEGKALRQEFQLSCSNTKSPARKHWLNKSSF